MTRDMDSPTGIDLEPHPPATVRVRKMVGIAVVIGVGFIGGAIVLAIYQRQHRQFQVSVISAVEQKARPATSAGKEVTSNIPAGDVPVLTQNGVLTQNQVRLADDNAPALPPARQIAGSGQRSVPTAVRAPVLHYQNEPQLVEDTQRTIAYEKEREAIEAPTSIGVAGRTYSSNTNPAYPAAGPLASAAIPPALNALVGGPGVASLSGGGFRGVGGMSQTAEYNAQNGQDEKSGFFAKARSRVPDNYLASVRTAPMSRCEIKAGWEIPAILEQAINSDQPGEIKALVRENVYDTATGRYVLIPQGSRLTGYYNSVVSYGEDSVQAVWSRVIFPDGSSLNLNGMIGQDAQGESGLRYAVDHHYARLVGFAVLTSLFSAGFQLSQNRPGTILATPSTGEVIAGAVGTQVSQLGVEITRRNLNVQPTIKVPTGYRFNVRVHRDIVFDAPYSPFR